MAVRHLRGNVVKILNGMVQQATIRGFRTNLYTKSRGEEVIVTVTAPATEAVEATREAVRQALASLPFDVVVRVEEP